MTVLRLIARTAAAALLLLASASTWSQAVDTSEWICEFCPFASGHRGEYTAGATTVSDDSAFFGDASGYDEDGVYANVDGAGAFAGDDHRVRWLLEDLGLDSRYAELDGSFSGTLDYSLAYRELPRRRYFGTQSPFSDASGNALALPGDWVRAPVTSGMSELGASLAGRNIEADRQTLEFGAGYRGFDRVRLRADFRRQAYEGTSVESGSFFTQSSLLPGRFDYVTDEVDLGLSYTADRGYLALSWHLSDFDNGNTSLSFDNPFTSPPGAGTGTLSVAPDNRLQQLSIAGNYRIPVSATVVSFSAATGRLEQNEPFLPYTGNPTLDPPALPRASLDAEIDTSNLALALVSRPADSLRVTLSWRQDQRDNKTGRDLWTRVVADSWLTNDAELNIPYSFERSSLTLRGDFDLTRELRISGGYDRKSVDRDFQEVAEQIEDGGWGRLRWRPTANFSIDARAGAAQRDVERYDETFAALRGQNPLLRKYNLAYRYRRFGELTLNAALPDNPLTVTLTGLFADDSYSRSELGLTNADDVHVTLDLGWAFGEHGSLYANGGYQNITSDQAGSESFAAPDWRASNDDRFVTFGAGVRLRQLGERIDLELDYSRMDGTSAIALSSDLGGLSSFPDIETAMDYLRLRLAYQYSDRLTISGDLRYQRIDSSDWALDGVGPDTIPTVLTLGASAYNDDQVLFGLGFRYAIGSSPSVDTE